VVLDSDHESRVNTKFVGEGSSRRDIDTVPGFLPNRGNAIIFENFVMIFASEIQRGYRSILGIEKKQALLDTLMVGRQIMWRSPYEVSKWDLFPDAAQTQIRWCVLLVGSLGGILSSAIAIRHVFAVSKNRSVRCGDARLFCGWMHLHSSCCRLQAWKC